MGYRVDPNAKNVWVRDNADTMDLPVQTDANSVYFNNGRTMEQEFGKGAMVSNVVTVDSGMEKVIDGTYDGAYESLVFKGKSLVNLLNYSFPSRTDWYDNAGANSYIRTGQSINMLKPNTDYLMWFEGETTIVQILALSTVFTKAYFELTGKSLVKVRTVNGELPANFTIHFKSSIGGSLTDNEKASVKLMLIEYIEGMENWDIPYFEGLCDVKMPILQNVGKNLIPLPLIANTGLTWVDGVEHKPSSDYSFTSTGFIKIQTGVYYTSSNTSNMGKRVHCYDEGKRHLGVLKTDGSIVNSAIDVCTSHTFKIDDKNVCYIRLTFYGVLEAAQLEESSTATSYEDHKTNILETSNDLVLRGLPSGIRDTYDCLTGEYIRRVGERDYQESDESDSNVITDLVKTHYELAEPIVTQIEPPTTPFAYENGHIILESGHEGQSLLPTLEYQTVVSRSGQVAMIDKTIQQHERKITLLEKMLVQNIIDIEYKNTLLALKLEINEVI